MSKSQLKIVFNYRSPFCALITLPQIGKLGVGSLFTMFWSVDPDNEVQAD